ncbi:hypothetical protein evm_009538 [Chilo suppressalis]|nr:hypothetical protein evm_009538 [Chilo suppressalis]
MNKTCARCEKTVYPTEELKCLDKVWHKGCFKCQECGMTLNMRTYKGYGKLPYCEAHVPKAKHTTMAETPELKRIAENTKLQSNVKYHADFEKSKGKFTQVADDPETLRIKANTKIISNVAYHGDLEKKAQMEKQRQINENGEIVELPSDNYHQQIESYATEMLPPAVPPPHLPPKNHYQTPNTQYQPQNTQHHQQNTQYQPQNTQQHQQNTHPQPQHTQQQQNTQYHQQNTQHQPQNTQHYQQNTQYTPQNAQYQNSHHPQNSQYHHHNQNTLENTQHRPQNTQYQQQYGQNYQQERYPTDQYKKYEDYQYQGQYYGAGSQARIGRIQDYDPLSDGPRAVPNTQRASATLIYNSTNDGSRGSQQSQAAARPIGRVTDLDPLANTNTNTNANANTNTNTHANTNANTTANINLNAQVSFREGDYICNASCIDEGWMTGQVVRTGRAGMLPANYVELAALHRH